MKHISMDFWNTLGIPNPTYSEARNTQLSFRSGLQIDKVRSLYSDVKSTIDRTHSEISRPLSNTMCYTLLSEQFKCDNFKNEFEFYFKLYPPTILPETIDMLHKLREKNITLSIGSNTNFITGEIIKETVLDQTFDFDFYIFSDELGWAKPHNNFWDKLKSQTNRNICHVGDNFICDIIGPTSNGLEARLVTTPHELPEILDKLRLEKW